MCTKGVSFGFGGPIGDGEVELFIDVLMRLVVMTLVGGSEGSGDRKFGRFNGPKQQSHTAILSLLKVLRRRYLNVRLPCIGIRCGVRRLCSGEGDQQVEICE